MKEKKVFNSIGERIIFIRSALRITRNYLKNEYNISDNTLRTWENNKVVPSKKSLGPLIYAFKKEGINVSLDWLETGFGQIPIFNAALETVYDEHPEKISLDLISSDDHRALYEIKNITSLYSDSVYMFLSDDLMNPRYFANSWLIGRKLKLEACIGRDCIVKISGTESLTFRRVLQGMKKNVFTLFVLTQVSGK